MLEILIISAIVTARLYARDRMYAKQGLPPPSSRLVEAWLARQNASRAADGRPLVKPARYGMWRYFWQRWQAMWELQSMQAEQAHRQRVADRKAGRKPTPKPPLKQRLAAPWQWVLDNIVAPREGKQDAPAEPETSQQPATAQPPTSGESAPGATWACPGCGLTLTADTEPADLRCAGCVIRARAIHNHSDAGPDQSPTRSDKPDDPILHEYGNNPTNRGDKMPENSTQQSGEVTGLMSAIAYAEAVAAAHEAHSTGGGEHYRASLASFEVGPDTINTAGTAQEASEIAGGAWREHAAKLREQLAAKEATTAETGNKAFLTNE